MGCWGIPAFKSDTGLDAVGFIRSNLPKDGKMELGKIIEALQAKKYCSHTADGYYSHTAPMALAEMMIKFLDDDIRDLDYDEDWAATHNTFGSLTSFTADKESVQWLREYISDTLQYSKESAEAEIGMQWGGWFEEQDWHDWQRHMQTLVTRLDTVLASPESQIELVQPPDQTAEMTMM